MGRILFIVLALGLSAMNPTAQGLSQDKAPGAKSRSADKHLTAPGGATRIADQLVVKFHSGVTQTQIDGLNAVLGTSLLEHHWRSGVHRLRVSEGKNMNEALTNLRASALVESVGFNYVVRALAVPNDPDYQPAQWNLFDSVGGIWAESAWDLSVNKGEGVVVAVVDTGVAYENYGPYVQAPDLNKTFVAPKNFVDSTDHPNDDNGHGTHIAGTIAQDTNNGLATAGIAYRANIMPLKILDWMGNGSIAALNDAIYYAVDNGARVINLSLGIANTGAPNASGQVCAEIVGLNEALQYAYDHGVVVVAASGNEGVDVVNCPAAYPTVIAVGGTRHDGQRTYYSNGGNALDIVAPGGDLLVDQNGDGEPDGILQVSFCNDPGTMFDSWELDHVSLYGSFCTAMQAGTSMAAPHVSATVALMLGENPSLTPDSIRSYLQSTARDFGAMGWDKDYGWGLLNAGAAVAAVGGTPPPPPPSPSASGTIQGVVTDVASGLPIGGATVTVRLRGAKLNATTATDGSYILSGLAFGKYRVAVNAAAYHNKHSATSVSPSSATVVNNFALERMKKK